MVLYQLIITDGDDPMRKQRVPQLVHVKRLGFLRSLYYRLRGWCLAKIRCKHSPPIRAPHVPDNLAKFDLAIEVPEGLSEKIVYDLIGIHNKSAVKVVVCLPERRQHHRRAAEV